MERFPLIALTDSGITLRMVRRSRLAQMANTGELLSLEKHSTTTRKKRLECAPQMQLHANRPPYVCPLFLSFIFWCQQKNLHDDERDTGEPLSLLCFSLTFPRCNVHEHYSRTCLPFPLACARPTTTLPLAYKWKATRAESHFHTSLSANPGSPFGLLTARTSATGKTVPKAIGRQIKG